MFRLIPACRLHIEGTAWRLGLATRIASAVPPDHFEKHAGNPHIFQGFSEIARSDEHVPRRTATDQFRIVRYETDDPDPSWTAR